MNFINRISLIITPKKPMHQWIETLVPNNPPSFEELSSESSCYLLDEPTQETKISELKKTLIKEHFLTIWKSELSIWDEYLDKLPDAMTEIEFNLWFNVSFSGLTFDLANEPLLIAPAN